MLQQIRKIIISTKMQMTTFVFAATAVALATNAADDGALDLECEADHQCEKGYCYQPTGKCTSCTDCSVYIRTAPQWRACAKSPQECGPCQEGFEDVILTEGAKRDFCVRIKSQNEAQVYRRSPAIIIPAVLVVLAVIAAVLTVIIHIRKKATVKIRNNHRSSPGEDDTPPPPYISAPLLSTSAVISEERMDEFQIDGKKETYPLQQAVPFKDALPPFNRNNGEGEPEDEAEEGEEHPIVHHPTSRNLNLDDEDTLPSIWAPGMSYGNTANTNDSNVQEIPHGPSCSNAVSNSSLSDLSDSVSDTGGENLNNFDDSGLSATFSQQSSSKSLALRPFGQFSSCSNASSSAVVHRCHSEDDVSQNYQACKRARRDSGSASMQSIPPIDFRVNDCYVEQELQDSNMHGGAPGGTRGNQCHFMVNLSVNHETNVDIRFPDQHDTEKEYANV